MNQSPNHVRWSTNLLVALASVLVSLLLLELLLRAFFPQSVVRLGREGTGVQAHPPGMFIADADVGYALRPGFEGLFVRPEYETPVHVNTAGLRGRALRPRLPTTYRILALGDSFTWGYGATETQAWPYLLESALQEHFPEQDIQVFNGGVPGYGNDEELIWLRTRGSKLAPDLVVTMFFSGNDFEDNRSAARETHMIVDGMLVDTSFSQRKNDQAAWIQLVDKVKAYSHLFSLLSDRLGYVAMRLGVYAALTKSSSEYFTRQDAERTHALLLDIVTASRDLGARNLLVFVPEKMQILSGEAPVPRAAGVVEGAAHSADVPWLNLTPALIKRRDRRPMYYLVDGHWTPEGNSVAAEAIFRAIVKHGLLEGK